MFGLLRSRQLDSVGPLRVLAALVVGAAGCNQESSSSSEPTVQRLAASIPIPESFRNLGKRSESTF